MRLHVAGAAVFFAAPKQSSERKKARVCNGCRVGRAGGVPAPRASMCGCFFLLCFLLCMYARACREALEEPKRKACECCLLFFVSFLFLLPSHRQRSFARATVNIMDSRAILRVDMGFYMGTKLRPLPESLHKIHVLLASQ